MIIMQALNADIKYISENEDGLAPINEVGGFIGGNMAVNLKIQAMVAEAQPKEPTLFGEEE